MPAISRLFHHRPFSFRRQALVALVLILGVLMGGGFGMIYALGRTTTAFGQAEQQLSGVALGAAATQRAILLADNEQWNITLTAFTGPVPGSATRLANEMETIRSGIAQLGRARLSGGERQTLQAATAEFQGWYAGFVQLRDHPVSNDQQATTLTQAIAVNLEAAGRNLNAIQTAASTKATTLLATANHEERTVRIVEGLLLVFGLGVAILWWFGLRRSVIMPVEELATLAEQVGRGELGTRLTPAGSAELVALGDEFNKMVCALEQSNRSLSHQAMHDPLTGLPNRTLAIDRTQQALGRLERGGAVVAVMLVDLDGFKKINDGGSHAEGDVVLVEVGRRIRGALRKSDTVARMGGDEFLVIVEGSADAVEAEAHRLADILKGSYDTGIRAAHVSVSIGLTTTDRSNADVEQLFHQADLAMYVAKRNGGSRWEMFDAHIGETAAFLAQLEVELRAAVAAGQFVVYYQPTVRLEDQRITGAEALVRWQHPTRGLLPPADFLPLAEDLGLIIPIGWDVLEQACRQAREWRQSSHDFTMNVNLSVKQIMEPDFVASVTDILLRTGLPGGALVLEVTESIVAQQGLAPQLESVRLLGVRIAVDDFGTGYSSLRYLQDFPIDILKIDKVFVDQVALGIDSSALVATIIALADTLQLESVAEGIEQPDQAATLTNLGCDSGQGYLFARPVPPNEFTALLAKSPTLSTSDPEIVAVPTPRLATDAVAAHAHT